MHWRQAKGNPKLKEKKGAGQEEGPPWSDLQERSGVGRMDTACPSGGEGKKQV